jgi:hypothetical protein
MRLFWKILIIVLVVILILTFLPVGVFGEQKVDVTVSARVNQAKLIGWIPGFKEYNIDNVNYQVTGDTNYIEWDSLLFIADFGSVEFCIDSVCQYNGETFWISPTLKITFSVDDIVKDTYTEEINI